MSSLFDDEIDIFIDCDADDLIDDIEQSEFAYDQFYACFFDILGRLYESF